VRAIACWAKENECKWSTCGSQLCWSLLSGSWKVRMVLINPKKCQRKLDWKIHRCRCSFPSKKDSRKTIQSFHQPGVDTIFGVTFLAWAARKLNWAVHWSQKIASQSRSLYRSSQKPLRDESAMSRMSKLFRLVHSRALTQIQSFQMAKKSNLGCRYVLAGHMALARDGLCLLIDGNEITILRRAFLVFRDPPSDWGSMEKWIRSWKGG